MASGHGAAHWALTDWYSLSHVVVLVTAATLVLRKSVSSALKNRSQSVRTKLVDTRNELKRLQDELQTAKNEISLIESKRQELMLNIENEGKSLSNRLIKDAESTAQRMIDDARLAAETETLAYRQKLQAELVESVINRTNALVVNEQKTGGEKIKKIHNQLVDRFIREGSKALHV